MDNKKEKNPPAGCKFISILLILLMLFCSGYGFYKLFELVVERLIS